MMIKARKFLANHYSIEHSEKLSFLSGKIANMHFFYFRRRTLPAPEIFE
jgi:hypothetical protein